MHTKTPANTNKDPNTNRIIIVSLSTMEHEPEGDVFSEALLLLPTHLEARTRKITPGRKNSMVVMSKPQMLKSILLQNRILRDLFPSTFESVFSSVE